MAEKSKKTNIIFGFVRGAKRFFLFSMLSSLTASAIELINPQIIRMTVDSVIGDSKPDIPSSVANFLDRIGGFEFLKNNLWFIALAVVIFASLLGLFQYLAGVLNSVAAETLTENMRNSLFEKLNIFRFHGT